ncbi:hypothetical protein B0H15DRAFT_320850 [Mycena belliarum]|uniref:Uncharacterized protein n=1 Tax=Mycena belliarum TaxID=1033014 RepID=A0AAD6XYQ2_9AGAR|nr:hypothetical protein B0H15DRAFT_320850 [Mycena belliae]
MSMTASRPSISSPLAGQGHSAARITPPRAFAFPTSRGLRPFPSIAPAPGKKPVKMIQPPANQPGSFHLNLTQAEFSRQ